LQADSISGFHANTHIPVVIGSQMRYEVTGDPLYKVTDFIIFESLPCVREGISVTNGSENGKWGPYMTVQENNNLHDK
jgi:hypothetical protein